MIPTFNCASFLMKTLESVLAQDPGTAVMQIEVVDDCSTKDDPADVVRKVAGDRVGFFRKERNEGAVANFNTCVERSRGELVHVLHGDDYVEPGFYRALGEKAQARPDLALFACRSFVVDEEGLEMWITDRLPDLEAGGKSAAAFYYGTHLQTPSVVVRRAFYETQGGFRPDLIHTADCEMWCRAVSRGGGIVIPQVLACYRTFAANDSGRLARTAENLRDIERLNDLFAERFSDFDRRKGQSRIRQQALLQARRFQNQGDLEAARNNMNFWRSRSTPVERLKQFAKDKAKSLLGG
jgi:glycosyltransferase involved in cell wall biosynthesis